MDDHHVFINTPGELSALIIQFPFAEAKQIASYCSGAVANELSSSDSHFCEKYSNKALNLDDDRVHQCALTMQSIGSNKKKVVTKLAPRI